VILFQITFLGLELQQWGVLVGAVLRCQLFNIVVGAGVFALTLVSQEWIRRHWKIVQLLMCVLVLGGFTRLALFTGQSNLVLVTSIILIVSGGAIFPWEPLWQASFAVIALAATAVGAFNSVDGFDNFDWLSIFSVIVIAQVVNLLNVRNRRTRTQHLRVLADTLTRLRTEVVQREAVQQVVQQGELTLRKVIDASLDVIVIADLEDGRLIHVNKAFEIFGFTPEEAVGKRDEELKIWDDPSELEQFQQRLKSNGQVDNMEVRFHCSGGKVLEYLVSAAVVELNGRPCSVSIGCDISERKAMELDLIRAREAAEAAQQIAQAREVSLHKIIESSLDSISIRDLASGRYTQVNKEFSSLFGYSRDEAVGRTGESLGIYTEPAQVATLRKRMQAEGEIRNMEIRLRHKTGRIIEGLLSASIVELEGKPCAVSMLRDITERKRLHEQLQKREEYYKSLLSGSSDLILVADQSRGSVFHKRFDPKNLRLSAGGGDRSATILICSRR
jgi:PAS domain S-box-containing protein